MEIRKTIKEIYQKYQDWRAPRCEVCGSKLVDQGKKRILFEGHLFMAPTWRFEISYTEKGSLRFQETSLGVMSGITSIIIDKSWCKQDAPSSWSLIDPNMICRRRNPNEN